MRCPCNVIVLTTPRLLLRHFEPEDLDPLFALYGDPEMRRYYPDGTRTREETRYELEWFKHGHPEHPQLGLWATIDRQTGAFLGRCGLLHWVLDGRPEVEVAYMIDKRRWGQGLGTEAALGIVQHAQQTLGLQRLVCLVTPGNDASAAVATKIGMRLERAFEDEFGPGLLYALAPAHGSA
jgi:ribosomal-protein-alanine N-acetyltransferase